MHTMTYQHLPKLIITLTTVRGFHLTMCQSVHMMAMVSRQNYTCLDANNLV